MSYYEPGLGAMLVKEGSLHSTEFVVATGLAAKQLRDTCLFADAAAVRIRELEAALRHANAQIGSTPHGDNCFLTDEFPGNQCLCGKISALAEIDSALEREAK